MKHRTIDNKIKYRKVTESYTLNQNFENILSEINEAITSVQEKYFQSIENTFPGIHIIGVPRSGTTLLSQLMIDNFDVGYINNLIASFWKAPVFGVELSKKLLSGNNEKNFISDFGRTQSIYEANEFNYLWYELLGYGDHIQRGDNYSKKINWSRVKKVLNNIIFAYGKPVVFKSFMLGWHASEFQKKCKNACFVWVKRDPFQTAVSILNMRKNFLGNVDEWASFKPEKYNKLKNLSYWEQVAGQVYYLEKVVESQIKKLPKSNYVIVEYENLCIDPKKELGNIKKLVNQNGGSLQLDLNRNYEIKPVVNNRIYDFEYKKLKNSLSNFYNK